MRGDFKRYFLVALIFLPVIWIFSCSGRNGGISEKSRVNVTTSSPIGSSEKLIRIKNPDENSEFKLKDQITVMIEPENKNKTPDSVKVYFDGRLQGVLKSEPWNISIPSSETSSTGRKPLKVVAYKINKIQSVTRFVIVYSNTVPQIKRFSVIHTYPHDPEAFTQGLFYDDGVLYEGTGQEAGSSLRQVILETGKVIRQHNLDPSLFGEGITLYDDRIYQVTWTNKIGFVYDKETFKTINKIYYQTQGWGLTTIDDRIVLSDGSNVLFFYEPEMFNLISKIEVYDNKKKVDQLNELEYINGEIWANIWQSDLIARIDPKSGKINSYIDLSPLYPQEERSKTNSDVLNGIAFDAINNRIFVTGKRWPKLYEIKIIE